MGWNNNVDKGVLGVGVGRNWRGNPPDCKV